ncbi:MAG: hypothetical protein JWQ54_5281 [Mucilaginibacter sp.]|nr:hypothetical protein [Mucilaginibacter sp.]
MDGFCSEKQNLAGGEKFSVSAGILTVNYSGTCFRRSDARGFT